jgi:hypothetical protein
MGSRLKLESSYESVISPDCDNRYGFDFLRVSQHSLRIDFRGAGSAFGAWKIACLKAIEVIADLHPACALPVAAGFAMGVEPFAPLQRFNQQIELSTHHPLEGLWAQIQGDVSFI